MTDIQDYYFTSTEGLNLFCKIFEPAPIDNKDHPQKGVVLCLPGLTRNSRDFELLATHLQSRGRRVLTPDLRGRGHSEYDKNWQRYQPTTYAADLWNLLDRQPSSRCAIIGTSLGALLAMLMAAQRPQRIAGIVLNDAGPEIDGKGLARIAQYVGLQTSADSWQQAAAQNRATYGNALPGLSAAQWLDYTRRGWREGDDGRIEPDMDPHIGTALRNHSDASAPDLWPLYAQIQALPMLVIRGAFSDILSTATLARMAREKPDLQQFTVSDRGHAPLLDEPGCTDAIDRFLDGLDFTAGEDDNRAS